MTNKDTQERKRNRSNQTCGNHIYLIKVRHAQKKLLSAVGGRLDMNHKL